MTEAQTTTDPIEAEALGLDVEFEALGRSWRARGPKRTNNVTLLRIAREADGLGVYEYLLGEDQVDDLETLIDEQDNAEQAFADFDEALQAATSAAPGKSRKSRQSSKTKRRR